MFAVKFNLLIVSIQLILLSPSKKSKKTPKRTSILKRGFAKASDRQTFLTAPNRS
jgi:hypothetical protein